VTGEAVTNLPTEGELAVANYLAKVKGNLFPKEKCPHCGGSNAPYDQVDCEDLPCRIGRDFHRPRLEEVIQHIEGLLGVSLPVGAENVSVGVSGDERHGLHGAPLQERTYADEPLNRIKAMGELVQDVKGIEISGNARKVAALLLCGAAVPDLVARIDELEGAL